MDDLQRYNDTEIVKIQHLLFFESRQMQLIYDIGGTYGIDGILWL